MTSRLKLITIDAFGTIFTFKESPIRTYCRIFSNHGYKCSEQSVSNHFKASMKRQNEMWPYYGATSGMTSKQWWIALVHSTSKGFMETSYDFDRVAEIGEELYATYTSPSAYVVYSDFERFIKFWKHDRDVKVAALSNSDARLRILLDKMDLAPYFDHITTSDEVKSRKPEEEIFLRTLHHFGSSILPEEVLHLGDDKVLDYQAATSLGWKSLLINRNKAQEPLLLETKQQQHECSNFDEATCCIKLLYGCT